MAMAAGTTEGIPNDERVLGALQARDWELATTLMLREHGPEILRLFAAVHRNADDASEVFSAFAEALWKAVPRFELRSSVRTWMYGIARRVSLRFRREERRRKSRFEPFPEGSTLLAVEVEVRTKTLSYLRTERKTKLSALRESLPEEDRMLLVLRIDRKLPWNDLALVLREDEGEGPMSEDDVKREAARLRKRFQLLKDKLRALGRREGLLGGPDDS